MKKKSNPRVRPLKEYQDDLRLLRKFYTGFDARNGFYMKDMGKGQRQLLRYWGPQIRQLRALDQYPHVEVKPKSKRQKNALSEIFPVSAESLQWRVKSGTGKRARIKTVQPKPRRFPVFVTDPKAKVSVNRDKSVKIIEHGHERDVYTIDRKEFAKDPYGYMLRFMKSHRAKAVTLNVGGNVIGHIMKPADFMTPDEKRRRVSLGEKHTLEPGLFVTIVEKYQDKDPAKAQRFLDSIGAISVLRGGTKAVNDFQLEVLKNREALREARKAQKSRARQTARARATGRR